MAQRRRRLAARRRACGYSQEAFAETVGVERTTVARWDSGETEPQPWHRRKMAKALQVPLEELDRLLADVEPAADHGQTTPPARTAQADSISPDTLAESLTRSSVSRQKVDYLERMALTYVARYPSTPAYQMWPSVRGSLSHAGRAVCGTQTLRDRRRLTRALSVLSGTAGNLALDLGRPLLGDEYMNLSRLAAEEAEDADLNAWAIGLHSISLSVLGSCRPAAEALERASKIAQPVSTARRRSWLAALRARAYAGCLAETAARSSLDDAYAAMQEAGPIEGTDFFDQPRLDGAAGTTYLLLRDYDRAAAMLAQALQQRPPNDIKGRALIKLDQAACQGFRGEPEEALATIGQALDLARGQYV